MLNKADLNLGAAQLLEEKGFYASAVSRYYYSSLLKLKKIKEVDLGQPHDNFIDEGSHIQVANAIRHHLKEIRQTKDANDFKRLIAELKSLRTKADYSNEQIYMPACSKANELRIKIDNLLK